jgi:hypothetical protein
LGTRVQDGEPLSRAKKTPLEAAVIAIRSAEEINKFFVIARSFSNMIGIS